MEFPDIAKGSKGSLIDLILAFLAGWASRFDCIPGTKWENKIVVDGVLGDIGVNWLQLFQKSNGIADSGVVDSITRAKFAEFGLNLEEVAKTHGGVSVIIKPNGDKVYWAPPEFPVVWDDTPALPEASFVQAGEE